ncbi:MAG: DUF4832 domain-containing protein [Deltaproteobacteria bacterium]|nr:DUF4832 domain-containing protein [Deltaproteobacteria bacterium]
MRLALLAALSIGCGSAADDGALPAFDAASSDDAALDTAPADTRVADAPDLPDPPLDTRTYEEDDAAFGNPERGWMDGGGIGLVDGSSYVGIRDKGFTLAYAKVRLDTWRAQPLPKTFLDALDAGFGRVRAAGIKVVLRFVYNDGSGGDASEATILGHIAQLRPVLAKNVDAIAVWQGGFIGAWGEWHSSTNGLDNPTSRRKIAEAMLTALPKERMIQLRTPHFKAELWKDPTPEALWFTGEEQGRVGHHNDCFLASASDEGTYVDPIATWKDWLEKDVRALPMGGESCRKNALTTCDNAQKELARFRWSFYNPYWHPDVFAQWGAEGCRDAIGKRLGYRLVLDEASWARALPPGGVLPIRLKIRNVGWAPMFNPRPLRIVLDDGKTRQAATLPFDPRRFLPGTTTTVTARLRVPANATVGKARLELWLPDPSGLLAPRPEYAVHVASKGVWDGKRGTNLLTDALPIDDAIGGAIDPTAKELAVIE